MSSDMFHQWETTLSQISSNDPSIKWIDAMCFLMGNNGAQLLAHAMATNTHVTRINLRLNRIGVDGITAIANCLVNNSSIVELNLAANDLGDDGAVQVAGLIEGNCSLKRLTLIRCKITAIGTAAVATSLRRNKTLNWLNIAENNPGENFNGVDEMIHTLEVNSNLRHLSIDANDPDRREYIERLCKLNTKVGMWEKQFREEILIQNDKNVSTNDVCAVLLYPMVWSKVSSVPGSLGVCFELVKDCAMIFSSFSSTSNQKDVCKGGK